MRYYYYIIIMVAEKMLNVYIPEELLKDLKILSARENRSIKDIVNGEMINYVKIHKEGNPQHLIEKWMDNEDFTGFPAVGIDYDKKIEYIKKNLQENERLNPLGNELWGHICQWYAQLKKF